MKKKCVVLGGCGFIGSHLAKRLHEQGHKVRCVDRKYNKFMDMSGIEVMIADLRNPCELKAVLEYDVDEVYMLAELMGGAGYVFSGGNDADIIHSGALLHANVAKECVEKRVKKVFFSSSACALSQDFQKDPVNNPLTENMAWPANPDSSYGKTKLFAEEIYLAFERNYNLNIRIARFHNIMGEKGTFYGGREKAPAAMCRKVIMAENMGTVEVWGKGDQVRSFLHVSDCLDAVQLLMDSDHKEPINIGSEESISINDLARMAIEISGKDVEIENIEGPTGVAGRSSDNTKIKEVLGWEPKLTLQQGMELLYAWMKYYISVMPVISEMNPDTNEIKRFVSEVSLEGKSVRHYL